MIAAVELLNISSLHIPVVAIAMCVVGVPEIYSLSLFLGLFTAVIKLHIRSRGLFTPCNCNFVPCDQHLPFPIPQPLAKPLFYSLLLYILFFF